MERIKNKKMIDIFAIVSILATAVLLYDPIVPTIQCVISKKTIILMDIKVMIMMIIILVSFIGALVVSTKRLLQ